MKISRTKLVCILSIVVLVFSIIGALVLMLNTVDFYDNPAMLIGISDKGIIVLETYDGKLIGQLKGVRWHKSQNFYLDVMNVIRIAQQDKVAFSHHNNGDLTIWYHNDNSVVCLNDSLKEIYSKYDNN